MAQKIIDLSQQLATGMQVFPLHSPTHILPWAKHETYGFASEAIFCNSHAGTHVDAPYHFIKDAETVDELDLHRFFGPAVVFDLTDKPRRSLITDEDLARCEQQVPIEPDDIVLLYTGIDGALGSKEYISEYSGLSEAGAQYLIQRQVKAVGTDAPGIDHPEARACPAHYALLPKGVLIFENLAELGSLVATAGTKRFNFYGLPLKIRRGTGSPVRAMAVLETGDRK
jgi:arylformamidase